MIFTDGITHPVDNMYFFVLQNQGMCIGSI